MKSKFNYVLLFTFVAAFWAPKVKSQTLIQFWDFNQTRPLSGSGGDSLGTVFSYANSLGVDTTKATWPLTANYVAKGLTAGHILYFRPTKKYYSAERDSTLGQDIPGATIYDYSNNKYSYFSSSDSSFPEGNSYIKAINPSDSCMMYLSIPTTGYTDIVVQYAVCISSSKGPNYNLLSYSTNAGVTWNNLTRAIDTFNTGGVFHPDTLVMINSVTLAKAWYPVHLDFTSDPNVNNNPLFVLRWMIAGPNTTKYGASGNDRYDNINVWGTPVATGIESIANMNTCNLYPNPVNTMLNVQLSANTTAANISIYNELGQLVKQQELKGTLTGISTGDLPTGIYLCRITDLQGSPMQISKINVTH